MKALRAITQAATDAPGGPLEHSGMVRAGDSFAGAVGSSGAVSGVVPLAPDRWQVPASVTINRSMSIVGFSKETTLERPRGGTATPILVTGDDVTIENLTIRTESGTGRSAADVAITVTGDRCIIRNVSFIGFATAISVSGATHFRIEGCDIRSQTGVAINIDNGDYGIVSNNIIATNATGNEIDLDSNSQYNSVTGNSAGAGAISIATSGGQLNKYAGNVPTASTT